MSVFTSQPFFVPPPSYSRTKIQPPPYKAAAPTPTPATISSTVSFNPFATLKRVFTNFSAATSSASIPLSTTKTNSSRITPSQSPAPSDDHSSPTLPPPTYSPFSSPKPPAYSPSPSPIITRSNTSIAHEQPTPSQVHGLAFDYSADEWEREERRRYEEAEAASREKEDVGCCASWWGAGREPLPWAAYYVF